MTNTSYKENIGKQQISSV